MRSPRVFVDLFCGKPFHRLLEVLAAVKIPADVIGLPAHGLPFADGRGKEITVLMILAAVKCLLYCCHVNLPVIYFF